MRKKWVIMKIKIMTVEGGAMNTREISYSGISTTSAITLLQPLHSEVKFHTISPYKGLKNKCGNNTNEMLSKTNAKKALIKGKLK